MERSYRKREAVWIAPVFSVVLGACLCTSVRRSGRCRGHRVFREQDPPGPGRTLLRVSFQPGEEARGGLRLDARDAMRTGGDSGPAVVPGNLDESLLFQAITAARGRRADASQRKAAGEASSPISASGSRWVRLTRATARRPPCQLRRRSAAPTGGRSKNSNARPCLTWLRVRRAGLPTRSTHSSWPSCAKTGSRLRREASRRDLIRRLSFDLLGLPPDARGGRGVRDRPVRRCLRAARRSTARQPSLRRALGAATGWTWSTSPRLTGTTRIASGPMPGPTAIT